MLKRIIAKLQRSPIEYDLKPFKKMLTKIDLFAAEIQLISDDELKIQLQLL